VRTSLEKIILFNALGILSGFLLAVAHLYPLLAPVQLVALLPVLYVVSAEGTSRWNMLAVGIFLGLGFTFPQLVTIELPLYLSLILLVYLTTLLSVFIVTSGWFLRKPTLAGAFTIGALLTLTDWVNFTVVPMWGTAQSFVRPWSAYPELIQFVSITGITGISFFVGTVPALLIHFICRPKNRTYSGLVLAGLFGLLLAANLVVHLRKPAALFPVAALGWSGAEVRNAGGMDRPEVFQRYFEEPVTRAAGQGTRLVVAPELSFFLMTTNAEEMLGTLQSVARRNGVYLAVGVYHEESNENRLLFIDPKGALSATYVKTHLIPFSDFSPGSGKPVTIQIDGITVGGMICQDDNFTDISRAYGQRKVPLVVVPTLDWEGVENAHFQSSIHRALETRYAIVRAAMNGISAIVSSSGEVLARRNHLGEGAGMLMYKVPLFSEETLFSRLGHWPVLVSLLYLLAYLTGIVPGLRIKK